MAVQKLKKQFENFLQKEIENLKGGFFIGPDDILYATAGGAEFKRAMMNGATAICKAHDKTLLKYNTDPYWNTAIRQFSKQLQVEKRLRVPGGVYNFAPTGQKKYTVTQDNRVNLNSGIYVETLNSTKIELAVVTSTSDASRDFIKVEKVFDALKNGIWNKWVERLNKELGSDNVAIGGSTESTQGGRIRGSKGVKGERQFVGKSKKFGTLLSANVKRAHTGQTTTTVMALEKVAQSMVPISGLGIKIDSGSLVRDITQGLKIDCGRERRKKKGITNKQINFIEIRLAPNKTEVSRGNKARDKAGVLKAAEKYIRQRIESGIAEGVLDVGLNKEASKPFKDAVVDDAINLIVDTIAKKNKKRVKRISRNTTKSPTINEKGITLFKGKRTGGSSTKTRNLRSPGSIAGAAVFSGRARDPSGRRIDENMSPTKLKGLINRRLPAEIRRNMGRPALINQTGRFSNSVELQNLRQGPRTLIGEYSYMDNPYKTFENQGQRRWPEGYNPKPLITKSIKNLAMQYVENKFTLRRV